MHKKFLSLIWMFTLVSNASELEHIKNKLPIVYGINKCVETKSIGAIFGAPGTAKSEQLEWALQGKSFINFDVRNKFLDDHFARFEYTDQKLKENLKKTDYHTIKGDEREWLQNKQQSIIDEVKNAKYVIFDEFDLGKSDTNSSEWLGTIKATFNIAQKLRQNNNAQIFFILHEEALSSPECMQELESLFGITRKNIIQASYFSSEACWELLNTTSFNDKQKAEYLKYALGHPSAYIPLINKLCGKTKEDYTFESLKEEATKRVMNNCKVIKRINPDLMQDYHDLDKEAQEITKAQSLFERNANGIMNIEAFNEKAEHLEEKLALTGLMGIWNETIVMPQIVKDAMRVVNNQ